MPELDNLLRLLKDNGGSDLHLAAGLEPRYRVSGHVVPVPGQSTLSDERLRALLQDIAGERRWQGFLHDRDADFAYGLSGVARFRASYFMQQRGLGAVFRIIPEKIVPLSQLKTPDVIGSFAHVT